MGVGCHLAGIAAGRCHRQAAGQAGGVAQRFGRVKGAAHPLDVRHRAAHGVGGQFQRKVVPGLQQRHGPFGGCRPQALPHGAVGGLAEIPALGVFLVGAARRQRDLHIGQRRAGQHAGVGALGQMGQHEPLPIFAQRVGRAVGRQLDAAAPRGGFQQQMHLGVVAQRFVVADALHRGGQRFFVQNAALREGHFQAEAALQQRLQDLQLHFAHKLHVDFGQVVAPGDVQLRVLVLQRLQRPQQRVRVGPGAACPVVQHGFQ